VKIRTGKRRHHHRKSLDLGEEGKLFELLDSLVKIRIEKKHPLLQR